MKSQVHLPKCSNFTTLSKTVWAWKKKRSKSKGYQEISCNRLERNKTDSLLNMVIQLVCVCLLVAQLGTTLCDSMDCSLPGSSVHGILQARTLEWVAIYFSRGFSRLRDQTQVSCTAGRFFSIWAIQLGFCLNRKVDLTSWSYWRNVDHQQNKSVFPNRGFLSFLFCCLIYRQWQCSPLGLSVSLSLDNP